MANPKEIKITFEPRQADILRRIFPGIAEEAAARALAEIMLDELLSLLDGTKRYMSLSHQYIDWIERIYASLLPGEEFRETRLLNNFRFPPGSAAYMTRVLRSRQNTVLQDQAIIELGQSIWAEYKACNGKVPPGGGMKSVLLSARAHRVLVDLVDATVRNNRKSGVQQPLVTTKSPEFVQCSIDLHQVHWILAEFKNQFQDISDKLKIQAVTPLN